jgi:hypothetical protein
LENKAPLFLQLGQRSSGKVNAVILNSPEAFLMAEWMNVQIAAWRHYFWKETNPGANRFYRKLSDRVFSQILLHEISKCTWDSSLKAVTSPSAQSEMSAIAEFQQQDWVKLLAQDDHPQQAMKSMLIPIWRFHSRTTSLLAPSTEQMQGPPQQAQRKLWRSKTMRMTSAF